VVDSSRPWIMCGIIVKVIAQTISVIMRLFMTTVSLIVMTYGFVTRRAFVWWRMALWLDVHSCDDVWLCDSTCILVMTYGFVTRRAFLHGIFVLLWSRLVHWLKRELIHLSPILGVLQYYSRCGFFYLFSCASLLTVCAFLLTMFQYISENLIMV
jgi:hypothetical protein